MENTNKKHKIIISVAVLFATFLLNRCSDSATNAPATSEEYFEATINGERWIGNMSSPVPATPPVFPLFPALNTFDGVILRMSIPRKVESVSFPD